MTAKEILNKLAAKMPEEYRTMVELVIGTLPDAQAEGMLTDLRTVVTQVERGDDDQARHYVNQRYGMPGKMMLDSMLEGLGAPEERKRLFRERIPSGNAADTSLIDAILNPHGRS